MAATDRVGDHMTTDVLSLRPEMAVREAAEALVARGVDGAPVVDAGGKVVGLLTSTDLIVQASELHLPTVVAIFGVAFELPRSARAFDKEVHKALGNLVGDVMSAEPRTCSPDDSVQAAATAMHDHDVSRLPVVDGDGRLVGIIARGDVLKAIVAG